MERLKSVVVLLLFVNSVALIPSSCTTGSEKKNKTKESLIIFHAGSLSVPFKRLADEFEKLHPNIELLMESAGSVECARKISELKKDCDIIASSDYTVIEDMLIPEYTDWYLNFAGNEMVIVFNKKSRMANAINEGNWYDILLKPEVFFGRSDPDLDPCGYRTLFTFQLAEKYYAKQGLAEKLTSKDLQYIRPKEVDLLALIESNTLDYIFIYKSVALQHQLDYLELPAEINQGNPELTAYYASATTQITSDKPGSLIEKRAIPMTYALSILKNAVNKEAAEDFVAFLLSAKGKAIIEESGQPWMNKVKNEQLRFLPEKLASEVQSF